MHESDINNGFICWSRDYGLQYGAKSPQYEKNAEKTDEDNPLSFLG